MRSISDLKPDFNRDETIYVGLKHLGTYIESRPTDLPDIGEEDYLEDYDEINGN